MIWANITKFGKNLIPPQNLWAGTPMGRRQLNYIRYNMYKKIVHGHRTSCAKKE